jgi:hypothetical protein
MSVGLQQGFLNYFRRGNDSLFQTSPAQPESVFDSLGKLPPRRYSEEVRLYNDWRWRRGLIQSVGTATVVGALCGTLYGAVVSRRSGRPGERARIVLNYAGVGCVASFGMSTVHHLIVINVNYRDSAAYAAVSATIVSTILAVAFNGQYSASAIMFGTWVLSAGYIGGSYIGRWLRDRQLRNFFENQMALQVPVHRISPELQPAYRAYLYDNRPVDQCDKEKQRMALLARLSEEQHTIDANAQAQSYMPEVYDWINMPEWWPFKHVVQTGDEELRFKRLREEELEKIKKQLVESDTTTMTMWAGRRRDKNGVKLPE